MVLNDDCSFLIVKAERNTRVDSFCLFERKNNHFLPTGGFDNRRVGIRRKPVDTCISRSHQDIRRNVNQDK